MTQPANEYLVISRGQWDAHAKPEDVQRAIDAFYVWIDHNVAAGRMRVGSRLLPDSRLVSRDEIIDGPFTEAKEVIGGFWFILAESLDAAAALMKENPCLQFGLCFELRQLDPERSVAASIANETPAAWR